MTVRSFRLIRAFVRASLQQEMAYPANFLVGMFQSTLNAATGAVGLAILFRRVPAIGEWDLAGALSVLGAYLLIASLRDLSLGPSLEALVGINGEIWRGELDFPLLWPVDLQFQASFRHWRFAALFDLALAVGTVLVAAMLADRGGASYWARFGAAVVVAAGLLYAALIALASLTLLRPRSLWLRLFNALFVLARYPLGLYPNWLRWALTWVVPVGVVTFFPARGIRDALSIPALIGGILLAAASCSAASRLFRFALRRYSRVYG